MISAPEQQAQFVLYMLSCVAADGSEGLDQIIAQGEGVDRTARMLGALKALREEVPEVAVAIPLSLLGKAIASTAAQEKVKARFSQVRQTHGERIDAFFAAHPEHRLTDDG
jgi:hypothetical protein